ncbi:MAG: ECF transporter S component [Christensenellales bacterium]|jgi:predicted membrane protein
MKLRLKTRKLALSGLFIALGYVLPFFTMQLPALGRMLLPMHIPALLCGFLCGAPYGLVVGFITPLLRSFIAGMPPFSTALAMAFELAAYGCLAGLFYKLLPQKPLHVYLALILAMLGGRIVWGLASMVIYGVEGNAFTLPMFLSGAFVNAIPGIIVQIVIIPVIVIALRRANLMRSEEDGA